MKKPLWKFTDDNGSFVSENADRIKTLYFPLCNNSIMSSITPDLHGDIKSHQHAFLMQPVSRIDLQNTRSSRNFWIYINPQTIWSAAGVSKDRNSHKDDSFRLEAGLLWHKITRQNRSLGLCAEITSFVPAPAEPVEIMTVSITNISTQPITFIPTAAIPLYARSAENLRDHRHVTSLFHRITKDRFGVIVTPTLLFDQSGHTKNKTSYFVYGIDDKSSGPEHVYPSQEEFTGLDGDLEAPSAVYRNTIPENKKHVQGTEAMGALRFPSQHLKPGETKTFIILMGIVKEKIEISMILNKFSNLNKVRNAFTKTKEFWKKESSIIVVSTGDKIFDQWNKWVSIQPNLRKIYGNSFLPDFDYGKGGRGWRDLWQDAQALILTRPEDAESMLINNFSGVRIDGTNATIIGKKQGEFYADRNNIIRVWMDHGVWPLRTILLYIHQSGNTDILSKTTTYFRDHQLCRGQKIDTDASAGKGSSLITRKNNIYKGSILEHLLVQNLVQFFNVGPHNHIRLEHADWNDGLDMAYKNGESVAFSALYAHNLTLLCDILKKTSIKSISICKELALLLDTCCSQPIDYSSIKEKKALLEKYFSAVGTKISGEKSEFQVSAVIADLSAKARWISDHIQKNEWLKEGFFNGYYDNKKNRVEGSIKGRVRMTLTGQTLPIMSRIASKKQIQSIIKNIHKYLKDPRSTGIRLNTDFKEENLHLGRAFSFSYGEKENGAFFNHMTIMYAYALYSEGFVKEGYDVINSIYMMAHDTEKSLMYPCLPEYFNAEGRGMYSYLTGSASWYMLTLLTQIFGIRGEYGDLVIEPKLTKNQFTSKHIISIATRFAGKPLKVSYINSHKKDYGRYTIKKISLNGKVIAKTLPKPQFVLSRDTFIKQTNNNANTIEVVLD